VIEVSFIFLLHLLSLPHLLPFRIPILLFSLHSSQFLQPTCLLILHARTRSTFQRINVQGLISRLHIIQAIIGIVNYFFTVIAMTSDFFAALPLLNETLLLQFLLLSTQFLQPTRLLLFHASAAPAFQCIDVQRLVPRLQIIQDKIVAFAVEVIDTSPGTNIP